MTTGKMVLPSGEQRPAELLGVPRGAGWRRRRRLRSVSGPEAEDPCAQPPVRLSCRVILWLFLLPLTPLLPGAFRKDLVPIGQVKGQRLRWQSHQVTPLSLAGGHRNRIRVQVILSVP